MAVKKQTAPKVSGSKTASATPKIDTSAKAKTVVDQTPDAPVIRRKEMVERIVASTGKKPNEVKSVLDGVLEELGKALSAGESLNLHPLGKVSINRQKKMDDREVIICKIRRKIEVKPDGTEFQTAAE